MTDPGWEDLCHLAVQICGVATAFVAFHNCGGTLIKSWAGKVALQSCAMPPDSPFAIVTTSFLMIEDLTASEVFCHHGDVVQAPFWRFYAAMPFVSVAGGSPTGFLGLLDTVPHDLTPEQIAGFRRLSAQAARLDELRRLRDLDGAMRRLGHELTHRVKNALAVVQAILNLSARSSTTIDTFKEAFAARLGFFSKLQSLVGSDSWQAIRFDRIAAAALGSHENQLDVPIEGCGPPAELATDLAIMLGMVLHELVVNAARFGGFSSPAGRLDIRWSIEHRDGKSFFCLKWREHDGPPVLLPDHEGFGLKLFRRVLSAQFHAEIDLVFAPEGLSLSLLIPFGNAEVEMKSSTSLPAIQPAGGPSF